MKLLVLCLKFGGQYALNQEIRTVSLGFLVVAANSNTNFLDKAPTDFNASDFTSAMKTD